MRDCFEQKAGDMDKKSLYKKIGVVALPIIIQNIIDASVTSADVLMLNYVGQDAISAVSLANSLVGILFMFLYGIGTGIAMLAAQYYGKGDIKTIEKIEGIGLKFTLLVAAAGVASACPAVYTSRATAWLVGGRTDRHR